MTVVNFNKAKKARAKAKAQDEAVVNRASFGRTKAQKRTEQADADRLVRTLDGAKRTDPAKPE